MRDLARRIDRLEGAPGSTLYHIRVRFESRGIDGGPVVEDTAPLGLPCETRNGAMIVSYTECPHGGDRARECRRLGE